MTNVVMLTRVLDILEKDKNIILELSEALDEYSNEHSLKSIAVFETDFVNHINKILYQWEKGETYVEAIERRERNRMQSITLPEEKAQRLHDLLESNDVAEINGESNTEMCSVIQKALGIQNTDCVICPMYRHGAMTGWFLYVSDGKKTWCDDERQLLKVTSKMASFYINRVDSDAASRMKTEFLSRMSHEIRTPMNAIIGMTAIASSSLDDIDRVRDCLQKIDASTKYLLSLVNDILEMSRIESGKMTVNVDRFSLDGMLDALEMLLVPQAQERNISLKFIREYSDKYVYGDELKLSQVLINLLGNALKFTPDGGKITLRAEELLAEDNDIVINFLVKDNGIGIADRNLERIFKAFEQADDNTAKNYGGTGLGLPISANLVKLMGGVLKVESKVRKGSSFYFTLSFKRTMDDQPEKPKPTMSLRKEKEKYDFTGKRVLVAEDNGLNAEIAQTILEMVGFETELAENGKIAVDMFAIHDVHYYDAVLMDVRMPVMDGLSATRAIRALGKEDSKTIPILAMTANAFDEDMKKSLSSGMNGHLSKPVDAEKLYEELKKII